jgi:hypothetical protein
MKTEGAPTRGCRVIRPLLEMRLQDGTAKSVAMTFANRQFIVSLLSQRVGQVQNDPDVGTASLCIDIIVDHCQPKQVKSTWW